MGYLSRIFYHTGKASANRPWTSIFIGMVIIMVGSIGFINYQKTSDPQALWVPKDSRAKNE